MVSFFLIRWYHLKAARKHEMRMKELGLSERSDIVHDRVYIKREKGSIQLECEELTKFFEYLTIIILH